MHPTYLGPKTQIGPHELEKFEKSGLWAAEEKHDGHWAEAVTDADGVIRSLTGRSGKVFSGEATRGILGTHVDLANTRLACELEYGTESATKSVTKSGYKKLYVFDLIQLEGQDTTGLSYEKRRTLLEMAMALKSPPKNIVLVTQVTSGFLPFFERLETIGGEGLVLKRLEKPYKQTSGRKTENWVRCKRQNTVDYVVICEGFSDSGASNIQVGLYIKGVLTRVGTVKNPPKGLKIGSLVGRVIECIGAEVHDSGMLRHGHFLRIRDDKLPQECILE